mgnify:FL=1
MGDLYHHKSKNEELDQLENRYAETMERLEDTKEMLERDCGITEKEFEELKNYADTTNLYTAKSLVFDKAEKLFNKIDGECDKNTSSHWEIINTLLSFILFFAIDECPIMLKQKVEAFDYAKEKRYFKSDFSGHTLFWEERKGLKEVLKTGLDNLYFTITAAAYKNNQQDALTDFTKTLCSMMFLLGEDYDKHFSTIPLSANGVRIIVETARKSDQKVNEEQSQS